jgi:hypothetical protein
MSSSGRVPDHGQALPRPLREGARELGDVGLLGSGVWVRGQELAHRVGQLRAVGAGPQVRPRVRLRRRTEDVGLADHPDELAVPVHHRQAGEVPAGQRRQRHLGGRVLATLWAGLVMISRASIRHPRGTRRGRLNPPRRPPSGPVHPAGRQGRRSPGAAHRRADTLTRSTAHGFCRGSGADALRSSPARPARSGTCRGGRAGAARTCLTSRSLGRRG